MRSLFPSRFAVLAALVLAVLVPTNTLASHAWGPYHWARTTSSFTLELGDNVHSAWDSYLGVASSDWSASSVLDTTVVAGNTDPKKCRPTAGRIEVCAAKYGRNGWLGVARIWLTGDHINQAITKVNDSYFTTATYDTPAWRAMVMCQEIGHDFGLDHQDEAFDNPNLGSCMDYTNDPATNQHPNTHDYDQLEAIYAHLDETSTVGGTSAGENAGHGSDAANSEWGRLTSSSNGVKKFVLELGHGQRIITVVITADR